MGDSIRNQRLDRSAAAHGALSRRGGMAAILMGAVIGLSACAQGPAATAPAARSASGTASSGSAPGQDTPATPTDAVARSGDPNALGQADSIGAETANKRAASARGQALYPSSPVREVRTRLPGETAFAAPAALEAITGGDVVNLHLTLAGPAFPTVHIDGEDEPRVIGGGCNYGPVTGAERVSFPTGSNHLLMEVHLGGTAFPANYLACNYAPSNALDPARPTVVTIQGCFFVRDVSIPTARLLDLAPLPGAACGIHP